MRSFFFAGIIAAAFSACALAETAATPTKAKTTSRPASAPASRPASPDAPLTLERRKAFNLALKEARQEKNPQIEAARQQFHSAMEKKQNKAENVADKARDNEQVAAGKRNVQARRRHPIRALKEQQKVLKNDRTVGERPRKNWINRRSSTPPATRP